MGLLGSLLLTNILLIVLVWMLYVHMGHTKDILRRLSELQNQDAKNGNLHDAAFNEAKNNDASTH